MPSSAAPVRRLRGIRAHVAAPSLAASGIDPEALKKKYLEERDKRINAQTARGQQQYISDLATSDQWKHLMEDPYVEDKVERPSVEQDMEVLCIGAGFGGILSAARCKMQGIQDVWMLEKGGGVGGTWYWNQYPDAACDVEGYSYMPLLEELDYMPQRKYAKGPEILSHCNAILDKYELTDSIFYQTVSTSCSWDEASQRWIVITDRGDTFRARYVVNSTGPLHKPKLADISGMDRFEGTYWHTSRWNWDFTGPQVEDAEQTLCGLHGLRVGIIGTGASAVQVIPPMAKAAKHLYVFQRTPSSIDVRADRPTDPERWAKDSQEPGFAYKRRAYFDAATSGGFVATGGGGGGDGKKQLTAAERAKKAADAANEAEMANYRIMQRIRDRIDEIVEDPVTAENLKPWYNMGCKRPCFHDEFLPTFNRDNVTLVHTDGKGIKQITEKGVVFEGEEYELDVLVYATGFETSSTFTSRTGFEFDGEGGRQLGAEWNESGMRTLWGIHASGYPNLFILGGSQVGFPFNFVSLLDAQASHVASAIAHADSRTIALKPEAEDGWVQNILSRQAGGFVSGDKDTGKEKGAGGGNFVTDCTPGYYNNEGDVGGGFKQNSNWGGGALAYYQLMEDFRSAGGWDEKFDFSSA